jgi:hypothetical protein
MRVSTALSYHDAYSRVASGYPLGTSRVQAVEPLPERHPEQPSLGTQLPVERVIEGEVLREHRTDPTEHLHAQRVFTVHAHAPMEPPAAPAEPSHPAIAAYRQNSRIFDPTQLGRFVDRFI